MEQQKYYTINNKYLAEALSFLGFHYFKYGIGAEITYSFQYDEKFRKALTNLTDLKKQFK